jgi:hypothetical protein
MALPVLPGVGWAAFTPVPGAYKALVYEAGPPFPKAGKMTWRFTSTNKLTFKAKFITPPLPPGGDGIPCSGDELICVVDVAGFPPGPPATHQFVFRAEVDPSGFFASFVTTAGPATPAAVGFSAIVVTAATCYPAAPYPPPAIPLPTSTCSGWYAPPLPPPGAPLFLF